MPRPRAIPDSLLELLNESSRPIYAIDDRRRIVFCNPALATWLELEPARIIGRLVEYHSEPAPSGDAKRRFIRPTRRSLPAAASTRRRTMYRDDLLCHPRRATGPP